MVNVYGRIAKISNVVGRSDYISNDDRQEEIILHHSNMIYSWQEHSLFEQSHQKTNVKNNEALEIHIALPNSLSKNEEKLKQVCDDLALNIIGSNKDYEYAVHWNHNRTNLHVHILFSERENQLEVEPKIYKKDIWQDKDSHKLAKANAKNAILVHKKGEIMKDKNDNVRYNTDIFLAKDVRFKSKKFVHEKNDIIKNVMKKHGFDMDYQHGFESPYLAQKKLYKNARKDYLEMTIDWNKQVKRYNENVKQHIEIEPMQYDNYIEIKKELLSNVKEANREEKKITPVAINIVFEMTEWIHNTLVQLKTYLKSQSKIAQTMEQWQKIKDRFVDLFNQNDEIEHQNSNINRQNIELINANKEFDEVIENKKMMINDLEMYEQEQEELRQLVDWWEDNAYDDVDYDEYIKQINGLTLEQRLAQAQEIVEEKENERDWGLSR